jgi:hypothetical protein
MQANASLNRVDREKQLRAQLRIRAGKSAHRKMIRKDVLLNYEEDSFQPRRIQRRASLFLPGLSTHLAADASPAYHGPMPKD